MKKILSILLCLAMLLSLGAGALAESDPNRVINIYNGGVLIGQAAVPASYIVDWTLTDQGSFESAGCPLHLAITATSADSAIQFLYWSPRDFLDVIRNTTYAQPHSDYGYDITTLTYMLRTRDASGWADFIMDMVATSAGTTAYVEYESTISPELQSFLDQLVSYNTTRNRNFCNMNYGITFIDYTASYANRHYSLKINGVDYIATVITFVTASTMDYTALDGRTLCNWYVPATYVCLTPENRAQEAGEAFNCFVENTSCSNAFMNQLYALNAQIRATRNDFSPRESTAYDDAFSNYIFDQNEYTTSDGTEVTVSTAYDYVWEDNGSVYFSNSADAMPYGADRLYAK